MGVWVSRWVALRVAKGDEVLLVSSGAVGLGQSVLKLERPTRLAERQACAAVGQSRLMGEWDHLLGAHGILTGQVLLGEADFDDRLRYLNLRNTLMELLRRGVVPIINENDAVATEELALTETGARTVFGDNDQLSALVATKLGADLLVLLTDVRGVYDKNPRTHADAQLLDRVNVSQLDEVQADGAASALSRGGMASKVAAARTAVRGGCHAVICSGLEAGALQRVLVGENEGTWFPAEAGLSARRRWIAFATAPRGTLHLDSGAVRALRERGASLLAAGVKRIDGDFHRGDVVELLAPDGVPVGRGMVSCDASSAKAWAEGHAPIGAQNHHALVHRDHLALDD